MTTTLRRWSPVVAVALLLGVLKAESIADPNVLWGIRDGRTILSSGNLPRSDTWSWTVRGKDWVPNSWGWDVVLGGLHRLGGGGALAVLNIIVVLALAAVLAQSSRSIGAGPRAVAGALVLVGFPVLLTWINDRPQLISYLFVAVLVPAVGPAITADRRRFIWLLAGLATLQVVWVNLHLFAILGPVLVFTAGVGKLLTRSESDRVSLREQALRVVCGVVVALVACGLTPYGPIAAAKTVAVHSDASGLVEEWRPAGFGTFAQVTGVLAILAAVIAGTYAYRSRRWDIVAALGLLIVGTAIACRIAPVTGVVAIPEIAAALSNVRPRAVRLLATATATVLSVIGLGLAVTQINGFGDLEPSSTSHDLVEQLPPGCRLLNDYSLGGSVILFRPDIPVAIDSRTDLYGRQRILANRDLVAGRDDAIKTLDAEGVTCVLIPSGSGLVAELKDDSAWRVLDTDGRRTLLVRS